MRIGSREIGAGSVYIIAEAGVNHNGDIALARQLVDAAKDAGADAIKFQTFTPDEIVTQNAAQAAYQTENTGIEESQASMLKKLALPQNDFRSLKAHAEKAGIEFLSTPFSERDADFLRTLDLAAYKVSSGDLTNIPFLSHLAAFKKPIILSTGMATLSEIREAVDQLRESGVTETIILQCTSEYPAPVSRVNLRVLATLAREFNVPVGFSDHTAGIEASVYAASLGASVIEKHFTLARTLPGPDHRASLEPKELAEMIEKVRKTAFGSLVVPEEILGSAEKKPTAEEKITARLVRKGVAARSDIRAGEVLTLENIFIARPEGAIPPREWARVLGKTARRAIPLGTSLSWDMLEI